MSIGSPLLFVHGVVRVKSIRMIRDANWEPLAFSTRRCACKEMIRDITREPLADVCTLVH
jgi:hypothetical protein